MAQTHGWLAAAASACRGSELLLFFTCYTRVTPSTEDALLFIAVAKVVKEKSPSFFFLQVQVRGVRGQETMSARSLLGQETELSLPVYNPNQLFEL